MAQSEPSRCTVVICTRDRESQLLCCLQALQQQQYVDFRILVVDSASRTDAARQLAALFGAAYLRCERPGLSRARNLGARACDTEIVAFLDDDAEPAPDWLAQLLPVFSEQKVMAVVGGPVDESAVRPASLLDSSVPGWFERVNFGGVGDGNNMAFRREAFELWPGFDERLGRGAPLFAEEEHHAYFELTRRGHRIACAPAAQVRHPAAALDGAGKRFFALAAQAAYTALLFFEYPEYRGEVLRFCRASLRGAPRSWRPAAPAAPASVIHKVGAACLGFGMYIWVRLTGAR